MDACWMLVVTSSILHFHAEFLSLHSRVFAYVFRSMMRKKNSCWEICVLQLEPNLLRNWLKGSHICCVNLPVAQNMRLHVSGEYNQSLVSGFMSVSSRLVQSLPSRSLYSFLLPHSYSFMVASWWLFWSRTKLFLQISFILRKSLLKIEKLGYAQWASFPHKLLGWHLVIPLPSLKASPKNS